MPIITRPAAAEYAPFFDAYVSNVDPADAFAVLENAAQSTPAFLERIADDRWDYRYAPDKWSLKESFLHLLDTERIFAYRALRIARGDKTPLHGFDHDDYVPHCNANLRRPESIIDEYRHIRAATLDLFRYLTPDDLERTGSASGSPVSVRAVAYLIGGHEMHHLRLAKERYLEG